MPANLEAGTVNLLLLAPNVFIQQFQKYEQEAHKRVEQESTRIE